MKGRFGTVLGGTHNQANGRFSLAAGYYARANFDKSAAFGFNSDDCVTTEPNSIKFCADEFHVNNVDLVAQLEQARRLEAEENAELEATSTHIAKLQAIVEEQAKELEELSGVREEQAALLAELNTLELLLDKKLAKLA